VPGDELRWRRQRGEIAAEAGELAALADLVGVLDGIQAGRVDLVGERLQLAAVALDLGSLRSTSFTAPRRGTTPARTLLEELGIGLLHALGLPDGVAADAYFLRGADVGAMLALDHVVAGGKPSVRIRTEGFAVATAALLTVFTGPSSGCPRLLVEPCLRLHGDGGALPVAQPDFDARVAGRIRNRGA
jgi:hypothetical protein